MFSKTIRLFEDSHVYLLLGAISSCLGSQKLSWIFNISPYIAHVLNHYK